MRYVMVTPRAVQSLTIFDARISVLPDSKVQMDTALMPDNPDNEDCDIPRRFRIARNFSAVNMAFIIPLFCFI